MPTVEPKSGHPGEGLLSFWPLLSIVILLCNDHWWKYSYTSFWTGKISDFVGLFFFPLLLQALWEYALALFGKFRQPSKKILFVCCLFTALFFAAMKINPHAGEAYRYGLALLQWPFRVIGAWLGGGALPPMAKVSLVQDETDLMALPMIALAYWFGHKHA